MSPKWVFAFVFVGLAVVSPAQVTTATFSVIVADNSGAVVAGASVSLGNEDTGATFAKTTDPLGECVFTFLPVGRYSLHIAAAGFKGIQRSHIELRAAQNVRELFTLEVGDVAESVLVEEHAPLVDAVSTAQRESFLGSELSSLPLAKRNFAQVLTTGSGITRNDSQGRIRLNGLAASGTRITVDGTEASGDPGSEGTSSYQSYNRIDVMSIESISEAQVIKGVIPAEYGQALGGNVNLITKSGSNQYHGSVFYDYQGAALSARDPFARTKPNFVWNQFGGSVGGPIVHNRIFFFVAEESYRETNFRILTGNVPTPSLRSSMLSALPFPETKLLLDGMPLPNQPYSALATTAVWQGPGSLTANDNHIDAKGDVRMLNAGTLSVTYTRGQPAQAQANVSPLNGRTWFGAQERITADFVAGGAHWTSESRFGINYSNTERLDAFFNVVDPSQKETIFGGRRVPAINCCGMINLGSESNIRGRRPTYDFSQKYAYIVGRHSLKVGGAYYRRGMGRIDVQNPVVFYTNVADMLNNVPSRITVTLGVNPYASKAWNLGLFAQDDFRVNSKLVLNLGLRYNYFSGFVAEPTADTPAGLFNPDGLLDSRFNFGPLRSPKNPIEPDPVNFGPRFGFAYNPDAKGKTVLRGGFGVMFSPIDFAILDNGVGNTPTVPFRVQLSKEEAAQAGLKWPLYNENVRSLLEKSTQLNIYGAFNPHIQAPYAMNIYLGVQRALTATLMLESAFVSTRGVKFTLQRDANQPDRLTGVRPNPKLGEPKYFDNSQQSFYASWQTSLRKHISKHIMFNIHHTWGKSLAYTGGDIGGDFNGDNTGTTQDFWCIRCERGPASGDITQYFAADWVFEVPKIAAAGRVGSQIFGGWVFSGLFRASTGEPLQILEPSVLGNSRPDVLDLNRAINGNCCGTTVQYLNPSAFIQVPIIQASGAPARSGNLGNHVLRGPGLTNTDFSMGKNFTLPWFTREGARLQLRADLLNALNHANYTGVITNIQQSNFGQVTNTTGARVIQLAGRINW